MIILLSLRISISSSLIVVKQNSPPKCVERITAALERAFQKSNITYKIGISDEGAGYLSVPYLYRQANAALVTAKYQDLVTKSYCDIGLNRLILAVEDKDLLCRYANEVLKPVADYDEKNGTDCLELLKLYVENDSSVITVAEMSGVHRNTVNNRIKLIRELLGYELTEKRKAELILAFQIKDILNFI